MSEESPQINNPLLRWNRRIQSTLSEMSGVKAFLVCAAGTAFPFIPLLAFLLSLFKIGVPIDDVTPIAFAIAIIASQYFVWTGTYQAAHHMAGWMEKKRRARELA